MIEIGYAPSVRASRISYVGELGWELYIPNEVICNEVICNKVIYNEVICNEVICNEIL